jgi:exosortase A
MSQNTETGLTDIVNAEDAAVSWRFPLALVLLTIAFFIVLYHGTVWSMISVWAESDTFAHGFVIFPISAFLVWRKRHELAMVQPVPVRYGPAVLVIPGFCWLLGYVSDVQVVQQYCFVTTIILLVWVLLGWKVVKLLAFPLGYLLFAVPFGKFLVPLMIEFSAVFAINALRFTGIPVFADGTSFSTPGANWIVLEVCSGMRYLIAALVVGTLYAYLTYRSQIRRVLFVLVTIVFTLIASGMRVYIIVMIGHFIDMRYAKGFDHLFIGWVFFGIVMLLLFWIGSFWREDESQVPADSPGLDLDRQAEGMKRSRFVIIGAASLLVLSVWPAVGSWIDSRTEPNIEASLPAPVATAGWSLSPQLVDDWAPHYLGYDAEVHQTYQKDGRKVGVYLPYYQAQRQGAELINDRNRILETSRKVWRKGGQENTAITVSGQRINALQTRLRSNRGNLLVYHWNWFDGTYVSSPHLAKLLEAKNKLLGRQLPAAAIIVYTDYLEDSDDATRAIQSFINDMLPEIERSLDLAAGHDK